MPVAPPEANEWKPWWLNTILVARLGFFVAGPSRNLQPSKIYMHTIVELGAKILNCLTIAPLRTRRVPVAPPAAVVAPPYAVASAPEKPAVTDAVKQERTSWPSLSLHYVILDGLLNKFPSFYYLPSSWEFDQSSNYPLSYHVSSWQASPQHWLYLSNMDATQ